MDVAACDYFRKNLRTAMEAKEVTQVELATALETSAPYVSRVLNGHTSPSLDQCEKMARAVGFPLAALLSAPADFSDCVLTQHT
jgi:transcriptional regulator with XRE-family HTH domain